MVPMPTATLNKKSLMRNIKYSGYTAKKSPNSAFSPVIDLSATFIAPILINAPARNEKMLVWTLKPPPSGLGAPNVLSIEFATAEIINDMSVRPTKRTGLPLNVSQLLRNTSPIKKSFAAIRYPFPSTIEYWLCYVITYPYLCFLLLLCVTNLLQGSWPSSEGSRFLPNGISTLFYSPRKPIPYHLDHLVFARAAADVDLRVHQHV